MKSEERKAIVEMIKAKEAERAYQEMRSYYSHQCVLKEKTSLSQFFDDHLQGIVVSAFPVALMIYGLIENLIK